MSNQQEQSSIKPIEQQKIVCFVEPPRKYRTNDDYYNTGIVLKVFGKYVQNEKEESGIHLGDWCFDDLTEPDYEGVLVWEGECRNAWSFAHGGDWEPDFSGKWRRPTIQDLQDLNGSSDRQTDNDSAGLLALALEDWIDERHPRDVGDCNLMIAFWKNRGDWPGCDNCDHQCDMPCMPITAAQAIRNLLIRKEQLKANTKGTALSLDEAAEIATKDVDYLSTLN